MTLKTNRTTKMTSQEAVKTTTTQLSFTTQASPVASSTPATTTIFLSRSSSNSKDGRNASTTTMTTTANNQTTSLTTNREVPSDESTRTSSPTISITTNTLRDSTITYITYTTTARGSRLTTEILSGTSYPVSAPKHESITNSISTTFWRNANMQHSLPVPLLGLLLLLWVLGVLQTLATKTTALGSQLQYRLVMQLNYSTTAPHDIITSSHICS